MQVMTEIDIFMPNAEEDKSERTMKLWSHICDKNKVIIEVDGNRYIVRADQIYKGIINSSNVIFK